MTTAVAMMMEVSHRFDDMEPDVRERIVLLLLRAARRGLRTREIALIPLVADATGRRVSTVDIEALAARRGGLLSALDPAAVGSESLVDPRSAVVATSEVRGILAELTGIRFQAPPRRVRGRWRTLVGDFRAAFDAVLRHMHPMALAWDRVHPNLAGHMVLANAFLDAVGFRN